MPGACRCADEPRIATLFRGAITSANGPSLDQETPRPLERNQQFSVEGGWRLGR